MRIFFSSLLFLKLKKRFNNLYIDNNICISIYLWFIYKILFKIFHHMTQELVTYIFVWVIAFFVVLSFAIWLEKMIKIILWNYILWSICFAAAASIDLAISTSTSKWFVSFMSNWKVFIILLLYVLLFLLIYHKSMITIEIPSDKIMQKSLYIFFVPLTVLSMCLTLEIILLGTSVLNPRFLTSIVQWLTDNIYLQQFVMNTPYWILIHAIATIVVTSEFKTKIVTDITDL